MTESITTRPLSGPARSDTDTHADTDTGTGTGIDAHAGAANALEGSTPPAAGPGASLLVEKDLLVEDVSIDGMCGVY